MSWEKLRSGNLVLKLEPIMSYFHFLGSTFFIFILGGGGAFGAC